MSRGRAVWIESVRSAVVRDEEVGAPGDGEVRIRADHSAISAGTEMLVYRGEVPAETALDLPTLRGSFGLPMKYGYALAGRVTEVGRGVDGLRAGDAVFALHPHQSECVVPAGLVVGLPDGVSTLEGVFFANVETALNVVHDAPVKLGETVAVVGQGVVGLLVTALLARSGAVVISSDPIEKRRRLASEFGASVVVEPESFESAVAEFTGGLGADAVIEASGSGRGLDAAIRSVASEGTVVAASWYGERPVSLGLGGHFHRGRVRLRSSQVGEISPALSARWSRERRTRTVLELMGGLDLASLVTHRFALEDAPEVYRRLDSGFAGEAVGVVFDHRTDEH